MRDVQGHTAPEDKAFGVMAQGLPRPACDAHLGHSLIFADWEWGGDLLHIPGPCGQPWAQGGI